MRGHDVSNASHLLSKLQTISVGSYLNPDAGHIWDRYGEALACTCCALSAQKNLRREDCQLRCPAVTQETDSKPSTAAPELRFLEK